MEHLTTEERAKAGRSRAVALLLPFFAALAVRLVVVTLNYRQTPDANLFYERFGWEMGWIARSLAQGHGYSSPFFPISGPTAMMPPLYPALLAVVFRIFGVYSVSSAFVTLALNSLFSSLICIPIYFAAKHSFGRRAGYIAAWCWALHPFAIYFSADRVWDYALTGLLLSTCFCIAQRLNERHRLAAWLGFGMLYGLTALANPAVLSTFPFLLILAIFNTNQNNSEAGFYLRRAALATAGVMIVVLPWTVRNYRTMHVLCPVRDNFWLEFWAGNTGDVSSPMPAWTHPASDSAQMRQYLAVGETAYIQQKHLMAVSFVRAHPGSFAAITVRRLAYFWTGFWSVSPAYLRGEPFEIPNVFFCGTLTLLMLIGATRLVRSKRADALPYLVFILIFPLTYYLSHPLMDYRQPIEPEILILIIAVFLPKTAHSSKDQTQQAVFAMKD